MTLRRILQAQYRFGEFPSDNIDPENKEYFESMFRMEPMERIDAYMAMTRRYVPSIGLIGPM